MISVFVITGEISEESIALIEQDFNKFTPDLFKNSKSKISIADFTSKDDAVEFLKSYKSKIEVVTVPNEKPRYFLDVFGADLSDGKYIWNPFSLNENKK